MLLRLLLLEPHRKNPKQHFARPNALRLRLFVGEHLGHSVKDSVVDVFYKVGGARRLSHEHVEDFSPGVFQLVVVNRARLLQDLQCAVKKHLQVGLADELA